MNDLDDELKALYDELKIQETIYERQKERAIIEIKELSDELMAMRNRITWLEMAHADKLQEINSLDL